MIEGFKAASRINKGLVVVWALLFIVQAARLDFGAGASAFVVFLMLRGLELEHKVRQLGGEP